MNTLPAYPPAIRPRRLSAGAITLALTASLLAGCVPGAMTTGPFAQTNRIDTELRRGVSTKADVERVLGKSNGTGGTFMPPTQTKPGDVWVYFNSQTGEPRISRGATIKVEVDTRDQMIMVFFDGDIFDGYLWFLQVTTQAGEGR